MTSNDDANVVREPHGSFRFAGAADFGLPGSKRYTPTQRGSLANTELVAIHIDEGCASASATPLGKHQEHTDKDREHATRSEQHGDGDMVDAWNAAASAAVAAGRMGNANGPMHSATLPAPYTRDGSHASHASNTSNGSTDGSGAPAGFITSL